MFPTPPPTDLASGSTDIDHRRNRLAEFPLKAADDRDGQRFAASCPQGNFWKPDLDHLPRSR